MPKVKFKIPNYEKLAKKIYLLVRKLRENYTRNVYINLSKDLIQKIINKDFSEIKNKIIKEIEKEHNIEELEKFKKNLEKYWNPLNDLFFTNLKKITGFESAHKEYIVNITKIIRGSYGLHNEVYTNLFPNIKTSGYVTAEELLHLYYWNIFRKVIKNVEIPWRINKEVWEISEVIPEFVLTDDLFKPFDWGKDLHRNYSFIEKWKKKLLPIWKNKKDFKDFMIKVHRTKNAKRVRSKKS